MELRLEATYYEGGDGMLHLVDKESEQSVEVGRLSGFDGPRPKICLHGDGGARPTVELARKAGQLRQLAADADQTPITIDGDKSDQSEPTPQLDPAEIRPGQAKIEPIENQEAEPE